ncbi:SDR family oxidoreductase [Chengkuizengella axinellae]|uniref:SDR family oxidoreductase n=1 Tax=Chengkuizengella axinellae TaxID=3064388 RepID=A0ABT9IXL8_9BACL|nr:SDR family oxidoreductase [Chengkuizengella sp. 2205SS18-9]MDP5274062.1 SDR family oxidoreductase [Chengkuizengella sp. 2205SS18-9]
MSKLFDLTGKTAVIVGGSSTLGLEMAVGLAEHGARIALLGRSKDKLDKAVTKMNDVTDEVKAFIADVIDESSLKKVCDEIVAWADGFDIIVNTAGKNSATPFFDLETAEWDDIMDVNLKGVFLSSKVFAKRMVEMKRPGSIINISSVSSTTPLSKVVTYSASKAGVNNLTQFLAREFAPYQIRVNAIIPGFFPAVQNRKILSEERINSIMEHTPMNRFGDPKELKGAVVYLASDKASSYVTGSLLRVDGGFGAMTI